MAWEVFSKSRRGVPGGKSLPPMVTCGDARLIFNAAATELFIQHEVQAVEVLWDREAGRVAVRAAPRGDRNSYVLTIPRKARQVVATATSFLVETGLKNSGRHECTWQVIEGRLQVEWQIGAKDEETQSEAVREVPPVSLDVLVRKAK